MIIITAPVHPSFIERLQQLQLSYEYQPQLDDVGLAAIIHNATGLVVATHIPIDKKLINQATSLQWIARLGSGMEHIDVVYAAEKNIRCISSPEGNSNAVAEHAVGLLLNFLRNISSSQLEVKSLQWNRESNRGYEIGSRTVGVIGYGNTGSRFAQLMSAFGARVLVYDKYKSGFGSSTIIETDFNTLMYEADIVSVHLPLNNETSNFINEDFFSIMKKKALLINTSRGGIMNTSALIQAIQNGRLAGALLDVLENEKLATLTKEQKENFDFLIQHPSVIMTPHIAGYTHEAFYRMGQIILEKLGLA